MSAQPDPLAGVGQAQGRVRQGVQPLGLDGTAAVLAAPEPAGVDPGQGVLDLVDQVPGVADQRQVALALEGEAAGVGELLVEADLAGGVGQAVDSSSSARWLLSSASSASSRRR